MHKVKAGEAAVAIGEELTEKQKERARWFADIARPSRIVMISWE